MTKTFQEGKRVSRLQGYSQVALMLEASKIIAAERFIFNQIFFSKRNVAILTMFSLDGGIVLRKINLKLNFGLLINSRKSLSWVTIILFSSSAIFSQVCI